MLKSIFSRSKMIITLIVIIFVFGVLTFKSIPKEQNPDIPVPIMYVSMHLDGISPEDSERSLVQPMEAELKSIPGIKKMNSTAYKGGGNVVLEFFAGYDLNKAYNDVKKAVDDIDTLPEDADKPKLFEVNVSDNPIINVDIWGDASFEEMIKLARDLKDKFRGISSVLDVEINGERGEVVNLVVKPEILEYYQITPQNIKSALQKANTILSSSEQTEKETGAFNIKIPNSLETIENVLNTPIIVRGDNKILLKEIVSYNRGLSTRRVISKINGRSSLSIEITKRTGTNLLQTAKDIINIVETENIKSLKNGIHITVSNDTSKEILDILRDLNNNIITAVLLIMIVVVAVLGLKNGLLVGFSIPLSFLTAILILGSMGFSLNVVVLFGLILSIGMLVDGALVVAEYAQRKQDEGNSLTDSFIMAIKKMGSPIISSTATTLAAFLPLLFWPGISGEFMKYIPLTLIIVLSVSCVVALIFMPVIGININIFAKLLVILTSSYIGYEVAGANGGAVIFVVSLILAKFVKLNLDKAKAEKNQAIEDISLSSYQKSTSNLMNSYTEFLKIIVNKPKRIFAFVFILLIASWGLFGVYGKGTTFFPDGEPNTFRVNIHNPDSLSLAEKQKLVNQVESEIFKYNDEFNYFVSISSKSGVKSGNRAIRQDRIGVVSVELQEWKFRPKYKQIKSELMDRLSHLKGIEIRTSKPNHGPRSGRDVEMIITGTDRGEIKQSVNAIKQHMIKKDKFGEIDTSINKTGIEISYEPNMEKIDEMGINIHTISDSIQMITNGKKLFDFRPNYTNEEVEIMLKLPAKYNTITGIEELRIQTPNGPVPIIDIVDKKYSTKVTNLYRENGKKIEKISANLKTGYVPSNEVHILQQEINENKLLVGNSELILGGNKQEEKSSQTFLTKAFFIAVFIMFIILLLQFNSFYLTGIIMFSIILSTVGVFLGLLVMGKQFSIVMSGVAIISLAGIVVNNNIVLIDTFRRLQRTEKSVKDAIIKTTLLRVRPVLLTSTTTALGLLPTAMGFGIDFIERTVSIDAPSSQMWVLLSQNILAGLVFSTILTLVITPAMLASYFKDDKKA